MRRRRPLGTIMAWYVLIQPMSVKSRTSGTGKSRSLFSIGAETLIP